MARLKGKLVYNSVGHDMISLLPPRSLHPGYIDHDNDATDIGLTGHYVQTKDWVSEQAERTGR